MKVNRRSAQIMVMAALGVAGLTAQAGAQTYSIEATATTTMDGSNFHNESPGSASFGVPGFGGAQAASQDFRWVTTPANPNGYVETALDSQTNVNAELDDPLSGFVTYDYFYTYIYTNPIDSLGQSGTIFSQATSGYTFSVTGQSQVNLRSNFLLNIFGRASDPSVNTASVILDGKTTTIAESQVSLYTFYVGAGTHTIQFLEGTTGNLDLTDGQTLGGEEEIEMTWSVTPVPEPWPAYVVGFGALAVLRRRQA